MNYDNNLKIWEKSYSLTKPFWDSYEQLFKVNNKNQINRDDDDFIDEEELASESSDVNQNICLEEFFDDYDVESTNPEYLEFIKITREHQLERDKLKKIESPKKEELLDAYYTDISQLNTLVIDNINEAPIKSRNKDSCDNSENKHEEKLIRLYGNRETYERIRSMEMSIDETFKNKCQELSPPYWPALPINLKPYLNSIE